MPDFSRNPAVLYDGKEQSPASMLDFSQKLALGSMASGEHLVTRSSMERETGIEPAPSAWKAEVLPLNYSRIRAISGGAGGRRCMQLVEGGGFEPPKA